MVFYFLVFGDPVEVGVLDYDGVFGFVTELYLGCWGYF